MKQLADKKYKLQVNITPSLASKLKKTALVSGMPLTTFVRVALLNALSATKGKS